MHQPYAGHSRGLFISAFLNEDDSRSEFYAAAPFSRDTLCGRAPPKSKANATAASAFINAEIKSVPYLFLHF